MRVSAEDRDLYAAATTALARKDWPNLDAYADAKSEIIGEILERGCPRPVRENEADAVAALWEAAGLT